mmetsp:Transcript_39728/g.35452  ORF Transcript_39728/g.35452 Transcript_39728/m.35452 type:complete len:93 (+) Transcript_39728:191-469(+)
MQTFLVRFFEIYSSMKANQFFITGESYAGHYIPSLASTLVENKEQNGITLSGVAIGNGLVNPYYHSVAYPEMGLMTGVIDTKLHDDLNKLAL